MLATPGFIDQYRKVIEKTWSDPAYKSRLLADSRAALAELGIEVPEGKTVNVVEDTADMLHFPLPPSPTESMLSDEDLEEIAAGGANHAWWSEYSHATLGC